MRHSTLVTVLSAIALVACGGGGASTQGGATDPAGASAGGENGDLGPDAGPGSVQGGPGSNGGNGGNGTDGAAPSANAPDGGDASAVNPADAAPVVTPDGCVVSVSPRTDACVLRNELGVFISASRGSDVVGDGTMASPFATAAHGVAFAKAHDKRVFMCAESYAEALTLVDGVSIFGGLDCSAAQWTVVDARAHFAAPQSPAARADNVQSTTIVESIEIFAPDATTPGGSSIGMIATTAPGVSLVNVWIQSGNGVDGADGTPGTTNVETGATQGQADVPAAGCVSNAFFSCAATPGIGTSGGTSTCGGRPGGAGGLPGVFLPVQQLGGSWKWESSAQTAPSPGQKKAATPATVGANGTSSSGGAITANGFNPGDGSNGTDGVAGEGGSGGDGDPNGPATSQYAPANYKGDYLYGTSGAGGGAGGCAGHAGSAGKGGGASIALVLFGSAITITSSTIASSAGGKGGAGVPGSAPTAGGAAGALVGLTAAVTPGAPGVAGGEAGYSGSGAGGHSIAIAASNGMPNVSADTVLTPGTGGAGQGALTSSDGFATKTIPASANGLTQAISSF